MKFLTPEDARSWCERFAPHHAQWGWPIVRGDQVVTAAFEHKPSYTYFILCEALIAALDWYDWALLWVTQTGVWRSNENLHLYYRMRQSYGNQNHVADEPAILSLRHEGRDLASFLHLGMLFGWDMVLVADSDRCRIFVSHDGYVELIASEPSVSGEIKAILEGMGLEVRPSRSADV